MCAPTGGSSDSRRSPTCSTCGHSWPPTPHRGGNTPWPSCGVFKKKGQWLLVLTRERGKDQIRWIADDCCEGQPIIDIIVKNIWGLSNRWWQKSRDLINLYVFFLSGVLGRGIICAPSCIGKQLCRVWKKLESNIKRIWQEWTGQGSAIRTVS